MSKFLLKVVVGASLIWTNIGFSQANSDTQNNTQNQSNSPVISSIPSSVQDYQNFNENHFKSNPITQSIRQTLKPSENTNSIQNSDVPAYITNIGDTTSTISSISSNTSNHDSKKIIKAKFEENTNNSSIDSNTDSKNNLTLAPNSTPNTETKTAINNSDIKIDPDLITKTKENFQNDVKSVHLSDEDLAYYKNIIENKIKTVHSDFVSQYLFAVDSNFKKQLGILIFWDAANQQADILGVVHVSTGSTREDHFITPTGFFQNSPSNPSFRALGTLNSNGIRGLGSKGLRVYDFGWQTTNEGWDRDRMHEIRFLMHATDPTYLEQRLGKPDSKGCVRIPTTMNVFLDHYGILDALYEASENKSWVLAKDREPVEYAGSWLLVFNTEDDNSEVVEK